MKVVLPAWPREIPRHFTPRAFTKQSPLDTVPSGQKFDWFAEHQARKRQALAAEATGLNGTYHELFFANEGDHTAHSNSTSEVSLISGLNKQPAIPAMYLLGPAAAFRGFSLLARGVISTTSTPTIIFQVRLGETSGPSFLSGTSLGVSAAITTASGISNKWWELRLDMICTVRGIGAGNATFSGAGYVQSPGGFASPFIYPLEPTTPDTATWTATFNAAVSQFFNISATWSAASSSNTITCKTLLATMWG